MTNTLNTPTIHREIAMPVVMAGKYLPKICTNLATRQQFIQENSAKSKIYKGVTPDLPNARVLACPDTNNRMWFYTVHENDLAYLMHLNPIRYRDLTGELPNLRLTMYQGSVWRSRRTGMGLPRLPQLIFWSLFKHSRRIWFSDSVQSEDGKAFWENRIIDAIKQGLNVVACHFKDGSPVLIDQVVPVDISTKIQKYWTYEIHKDGSGMNWRFAIY